MLTKCTTGMFTSKCTVQNKLGFICYNTSGGMTEWLRYWTLDQEVVGSNPVSGSNVPPLVSRWWALSKSFKLETPTPIPPLLQWGTVDTELK